MDVRSIDHVNLRVPEDGLADARSFYVDGLGFELEDVDLFEADEKSFFSVRLAPAHVLHLWPTDEFEPPTRENYDHVALVVDHDLEDLRERLESAGVDIDDELEPLGATGEAPALYVVDPFGYRVELKVPVD